MWRGVKGRVRGGGCGGVSGSVSGSGGVRRGVEWRAGGNEEGRNSSRLLSRSRKGL